jgi:hypothetical protein
MVEVVGGNWNLAQTKFTGSMRVMREWGEMAELRDATAARKRTVSSLRRVTVDVRRGETDKFIRDETEGIKQAKKSALKYLAEGKDIAYEFFVIIDVLMKMYKLDEKVGQRKLGEQARKALIDIRTKLRIGSDEWGALANGIK